MILTPARPASPALETNYDVIDYTTDPDLVISTITSNTSSMLSSQREPLPPPEVVPSGPLQPTNKATFTILLIGETGSGKTSFMSLLANLLRGNGPFELQDYHDMSKESGLSKTQSQTTKATLYEITSADGTKFHILDTPGLADTRGIEQDRIHKEEINNAIQEFVSSIDAVVIMANGTVERLTVVTDYTLNIICSMFPRTIMDNIGFIFTNCDPLTFNFDHESLQPELRESPAWVIQNPLAMLKNYNAPKVNKRFSANQIQKQMDQLNAGYDETVETLNEWLAWLDSRQVQTTIEIDRLYRISTDIESNIESALATITRLSEQREQYQRIRSGLHDAKKAKRALKDLEEREEALVWDRETTDEPNTICIAPGCYSNCHAPCNMRLIDDYTSLGRWCAVFKTYRPLPVWDGASAVCNVCQHRSVYHRHYRQIHVQKTRAFDPEKTRRFNSAETEEQRLEAAKAAAARKLTEIREDMASAQDTIRELVESYNEISLSRNFAGHVRSAIQMLRLRKEELNTKPDTGSELQLIDESISKFEQQLAILAAEETKWTKAKAIFQTVRDNMPGAPLSPRLRPSNPTGARGNFALASLFHLEHPSRDMHMNPAHPTAAPTKNSDALNYDSDSDLGVSEITSDMGSLWASRGEPWPEPEMIYRGPLKKTEKQAMTILLIGETGSGKTAFMSLLANLLHGHGPFKLKDYNDESKESGLVKTQSQTTKATLYKLVSCDGRQIYVLDTPGLADTRGIEQDKIHKAEINSAIQQHVQSIDAVIIMVNGTIQRLNVATDYALNVICSMFPHTILDNIGFMFTNSTLMTSNFDREGLPLELRESQSWIIQNPLAVLKKYDQLTTTVLALPTQRGNMAAQLQGCYEETVETLNDWLAWLDSRQVQSTIEIDRLYRISMDIESSIESALATITRLSEQRAQYQLIERNLQRPDKASNALKSLKKLETEEHWDRKDTDQPNTICIAPGCYSNCHAPCYMRLTEDYTSLGRWCKVFKNWGPLPVWDGASAVCKICQHPSRLHRHYRQIHYRKARVTDPEKTAEVLNATTEEEQIQVAKTITVPDKLTEINEEIASAQDNIPSLVEQYNEKSLSRSFAGHIRSAIQMLKLRQEELKTKPNTDAELQLIDESISKFERQLALLAPEEKKWFEGNAALQTVLPGGFPHDPNQPFSPLM